MSDNLWRGIGGITVKDDKGNAYILWANRLWTRAEEDGLQWDEKSGSWRLKPKP